MIRVTIDRSYAQNLVHIRIFECEYILSIKYILYHYKLCNIDEMDDIFLSIQ